MADSKFCSGCKKHKELYKFGYKKNGKEYLTCHECRNRKYGIKHNYRNDFTIFKENLIESEDIKIEKERKYNDIVDTFKFYNFGVLDKNALFI